MAPPLCSRRTPASPHPAAASNQQEHQPTPTSSEMESRSSDLCLDPLVPVDSHRPRRTDPLPSSPASHGECWCFLFFRSERLIDPAAPVDHKRGWAATACPCSAAWASTAAPAHGRASAYLPASPQPSLTRWSNGPPL
ncbi:hypothetical protein VPH35_044214 [Triticum aestivum]